MKITNLSNLILLILLLSSAVIQAQPGISWHTEFGGLEDERLNDIIHYDDDAIDGDINGYISVGFGASTDIEGEVPDSLDALILHLDSTGAVAHHAYIGGSNADEAKACIHVNSTLYVVGHTYSADGDLSMNSGNGDMLILSYNLEDKILNWIKSVGGSGTDVLEDIVYENGNIYAVGRSNSTDIDFNNSYGQYDAVLVSINAQSGLTNFVKNYGGTEDDSFNKLILSPNGNLYCLGQSRSSDIDVSINKGSIDAWLVKLDSLGNIIYENSYGGSSADVGKSMVVENEDAITIIAETLSDDGDINMLSLGNEDYWFFKVDNQTVTSSVLLGGSSGDYPKDIISTGDGHYVITGGSNSFSTGSLPGGFALIDQWLLKADENGAIVWQRAVGGTDIDFGHAIIADSEKEFTVAGYSDSPDGDLGMRQIHESHDGWIVHFTEDYISYSSTAPSNSHLVNVFPNPSSGLVRIRSDFRIRSIEILNPLGTSCLKSHASELDVSSLSEGLYFLKISLAEGPEIIKKLLVK